MSVNKKPNDFPPLMSLATFAELVDIGVTLAREIVRGEAANYPPLQAKKAKGEKGRYYITREAAIEWVNNLENA